MLREGSTNSTDKSLIFSPVGFNASGTAQVQDFILITSGSSLGTNYTLTINGLPATATNRPRIPNNSGYVGFEENAGLLITQIQENPNAVLLLDEIEKAHPDVATVLLQVDRKSTRLNSSHT